MTTTLPMGSLSHVAALRQVLRSGSHRKTRLQIQSYFHRDERGDVGRALDDMVTSGDVCLKPGLTVDGDVYCLKGGGR